MVVAITNENYRSLLVSLPIALALIVLFVFVIPWTPGLMGNGIDSYVIPPETPFYAFTPVFGVVFFVCILVWFCRTEGDL